MERSHHSSLPDDNETAPVLVIDGLYITDVQGWSFVTNGSRLADEVTLAKVLGQAMQPYFSSDNVIDAILKDNAIQVTLATADSHTLSKAILLLKKHWLFGEELYEAYPYIT